MKKKSLLLFAFLSFGFSSASSLFTGTLIIETPKENWMIFTGILTTDNSQSNPNISILIPCSPEKVENGSVDAQSCSISCNVGYLLKEKSCVKASGGWGGWGGWGGDASSTTTTTPKIETPIAPTNGSQKEEAMTTSTETAEKKLETLIQDFTQENKEDAPKLTALTTALESVKASSHSQELKNAYTYAFIRGITTQETIEKADLERGLTRAEMAKMMAVYATNVLGKKAIKADLPSYGDTQEIKGDLADFIILAYQLEIMGVDAEGNAIPNFNPYAEVTRAEFGTVLSRVLFGNKFNQAGENYFEKHLEALKAAAILKDTTPTNKELRGRVMLMLQRAEGVK